MEKDSTELVNNLLFYSLHGLTVIPLEENTKKPKINDWPKAKTFKALEALEVNDNIGIKIEKPLFVVDVDDRRLAPLILDEVGPTWTVKSRRGIHVYLKAGEYYPKTSKKSSLIQLLSEGCQVVAPPSIVEGHKYEFTVNPVKTPIAELDDRKVRMLESIIETLAKYENLILEFSKIWTEGHRHLVSLWLMGYLRKANVSISEASVIIKSICLIAKDPEIADRLRCLEDSYRKPVSEIAGISRLKEELAAIVGHEEATNLLSLLPSPPKEDGKEKEHVEYLIGGELIGGKYLAELVEDEGVVKLLVYDFETSSFSVQDSFELDGVTYRPYENIPFKLPSISQNIEEDPTLWYDTLTFIREYYDNPRSEDIYHVLVSAVAWSYFYRDIKVSTPFILFLGPWRSGKTRALEVMASICYKAMSLVDPSEASIFRLVEELEPTLIIDESQIIDRNVRAIMAAAYRFGMKVPRVVDPEAEGLEAIRWYNVFSFIIYASREEPPNDIFSRSVIVHCEKNVRPTRKIIDEEKARLLRTRWLAQKLKLYNKVKVSFEEFKSEDGRLQELISPLLVMATIFGNEEAVKAVERYGRQFEKEINAMESYSDDAVILEAFLELTRSSPNDTPEWILVKDLVDKLNRDLEKPTYTSEYIGKRLTALGFQKKRVHGGKRAYLVDLELLKRLCDRYGIPFYEDLNRVDA